MKKTESIAEFLARGGVINRLAAQPPTIKSDSIKPNTAGGPATIISLEEADLYHGDKKVKKAKKRSTSLIDISALPEELRKKYIDEVISGEEDDEEDGE